MLYDYECQVCGEEFEVIAPAEESDWHRHCPYNCDNFRPCRKIIVLGHGGVRRPDSTWVRDVGKVMEQPMETVEDFRGFLRKNPHIVPKESHPALPSSAGDVETPPTEKKFKRDRAKKAREVVTKMRRIEIQ